MTVINGYKLTSELTPDNSGFSKWGFAKKDGIEVFIKEFLSPVYPMDETVMSAELIEQKRQICREFENKKINFYGVLRNCKTGNIVTAIDFFRFKSKFYLVTEKVDATTIPIEEICRLPEEKKLLILKVILHSMKALHENGIVHSDIKPDNVLLKRTLSGNYTAKIIDFDSSFLENNLPDKADDLQGDMVYFAPESFLFIAEMESVLTRKIDVFALGILFHQYLCGELPGFDREKYDYAFEAVLDGNKLQINREIPLQIKEMLERMLDKHPARRPSVEELFDELTGKGPSEKDEGPERTEEKTVLNGEMTEKAHIDNETAEAEIDDKKTEIEVDIESEIDEIFRNGRIITRSGLIVDFGGNKHDIFDVPDDSIILKKEKDERKTENSKGGEMKNFFRKADDLF